VQRRSGGVGVGTTTMPSTMPNNAAAGEVRPSLVDAALVDLRGRTAFAGGRRTAFAGGLLVDTASLKTAGEPDEPDEHGEHGPAFDLDADALKQLRTNGRFSAGATDRPRLERQTANRQLVDESAIAAATPAFGADLSEDQLDGLRALNARYSLAGPKIGGGGGGSSRPRKGVYVIPRDAMSNPGRLFGRSASGGSGTTTLSANSRGRMTPLQLSAPGEEQGGSQSEYDLKARDMVQAELRAMLEQRPGSAPADRSDSSAVPSGTGPGAASGGTAGAKELDAEPAAAPSGADDVAAGDQPHSYCDRLTSCDFLFVTFCNLWFDSWDITAGLFRSGPKLHSEEYSKVCTPPIHLTKKHAQNMEHGAQVHQGSGSRPLRAAKGGRRA